MGLNHWFTKGMTLEAYTKLLDSHEDNHNHIYENFTLPKDDEFYSILKKQNLRAIVLAEVWCGHCMLNIPILLHLAQKIDMPVRFLNRDENLELMDQYLTNGNRTIPIFIFIDENGHEVAKWGPVSPFTKKFVDEHRKNLPAKGEDGYEEAFKKVIKKTTKTFRENSDFWTGSYDSMKNTLNKLK